VARGGLINLLWLHYEWAFEHCTGSVASAGVDWLFAELTVCAAGSAGTGFVQLRIVCIIPGTHLVSLADSLGLDGSSMMQVVPSSSFNMVRRKKESPRLGR
jgi:hypothetical protein